MPEPALRIHACTNFAPEVRAALPAYLADNVEVEDFAAACAGPQARCRELSEQAHPVGAERTTLTIGGSVVSVSRAADGSVVCALQCSGPSGYPLINQEFAEQLVADGAYLLTPGWARHWKSYLRAQGFDQAVARQYFHEFASQLVMLDTGTDPQAPLGLEEMGAYLDLPTRRLPCGLDHLRLFLTGLVLEWRLDEYRAARQAAEHRASSQQADYAVTLDMLGSLAGVTDEGEVAERVLDVFTLLFAPGRLHLLTVEDGLPDELHSRPPATSAEAATARLAAVRDDYELMDDGFLLLIGHGESRACAEIGAFAVPEKRDDYLNLALTLAGAFDLALANARSFGRLDRARLELRASEERYRVLMDQASDAIILVDVARTVIEANARALALVGMARHEILGRNVSQLRNLAISEALSGAFDDLLSTGSATIRGICCAGPEGALVIDANFSVVEVAGRRIAQGIFRDVTERERIAQELESLSLSDPLTHLRNRRGFRMLAEQQLKTAARLERPLLLLFADIDGLKPVNDVFGHAAGDQLLCEAAQMLVRNFRDMDIVARMGGDEFAVLQIDVGSDDARTVMERLAAAVATVNGAPGRAHRLSLSVGAAAFDPLVPCTLDELLHVADKRMYAVKARRKARATGADTSAEPGA